jgi:tRNA threonylcarbamoyladenosine biosynthesis protein TsaE
MPYSITVNNLSELPIAAKKLLETFSDKKTFAVNGQMGAGKTTFIKAICSEIGVKDNITSPTFSIVNEYLSDNGEKIYHFDFYRIKSINEAYDLGYEDYFYSNAFCFIEWPEKIAELIPNDCVVVNITLDGLKRIITANKIKEVHD